MKDLILAIDAGAKGAIVLRSGNDIISAVKMPETCADLREIVADAQLTAENENVALCAYLEVVHAMPNNGTVSMFSFGQNYGHLEQVLADFRIRTIKVRPNQWEKALGLTDRKGIQKAEHKRRLKARAQELFPQMKVTLINADALLISEYATKMEK